MLLVGSEWKPRPTPGIVAARLANWRPLSGRFSIRLMSTTPPTDELRRLDQRRSRAVTLTLSATPATFRSMFEVDRLRDVDDDALRSYGLKPGQLGVDVVGADRQRVQAIDAFGVGDFRAA